jgi:AcrR family transcriptional regulator
MSPPNQGVKHIYQFIISAETAGYAVRMSAHAPEVQATKGDRTRRRLLEIAVRRFAADGYRRTSVSDIAREAGLTPAAAYAYFAGKEALFEAAVDADASALVDAAQVEVDEAGPLREQILVLTAVLAQRLDGHPLARRVLAGREPEMLGRLLDLPSLRAGRVAWVAQLTAAQRAGEVRADVDPDAMATGIESIILISLMALSQTGLDASSERGLGVVAVLDAALRAPT